MRSAPTNIDSAADPAAPGRTVPGDGDVERHGGGEAARVLRPRRTIEVAASSCYRRWPGRARGIAVPVWFTDREYAVVSAASARLIPADQSVGAVEAGVPEYIDRLLGAFTFDPPRIWARGPTSGRFGGEFAFGSFHRLGPLDELAWRMRIEGSQGIPAREFNGPVVGWQERYRSGIAALGEDFCELDAAGQDERLRTQPDFVKLLYEHCCEGMYGAPEYGGNRDGSAWSAIGFPGDVQPRGWTDEEVANR